MEAKILAGAFGVSHGYTHSTRDDIGEEHTRATILTPQSRPFVS